MAHSQVTPTPPIFVFGSSGDLTIFDATEAAESAMESLDVEEGEYVAAFDAAGTRLAIEVPVPTKRGRSLGITSYVMTPVKVRALSERGEAAAELRREIVGRLGADADSLPLAALVDRAVRELRQPLGR